MTNPDDIAPPVVDNVYHPLTPEKAAELKANFKRWVWFDERAQALKEAAAVAKHRRSSAFENSETDPTPYAPNGTLVIFLKHFTITVEPAKTDD